MITMSLTRLEQKQAELEKKRAEIKAKIRSIRSKEQAEKRKKSTHYKVLLGAYALQCFDIIFYCYKCLCLLEVAT